MVLNGTEISGAVRHARQRAAEKMFNIINIDDAGAEKKFGFLLEALKYGAPRTADSSAIRAGQDSHDDKRAGRGFDKGMSSHSPENRQGGMPVVKRAVGKWKQGSSRN